eukprot:m51a1_g6280 hypothetical protein (260) ;mRNA; f:203463-204500
MPAMQQCGAAAHSFPLQQSPHSQRAPSPLQAQPPSHAGLHRRGESGGAITVPQALHAPSAALPTPPASPEDLARRRNASPPQISQVPMQQLQYLQEALRASRTPPQRSELTGLQRSFFDGVLALRRAEARASCNAWDAVKNYQMAVEGLLRVCSAVDPKGLKKRPIKEPEDVVRAFLNTSPAEDSPKTRRGAGLIAGQFAMSSLSPSLNAPLGGGGSGATIYRCTCHGLTFAAKILPADSVLGLPTSILVRRLLLLHHL